MYKSHTSHQSLPSYYPYKTNSTILNAIFENNVTNLRSWNKINQIEGNSPGDKEKHMLT